MKEIPFIWIDGLPGAGKTTLIEQLLRSSRKRQFAVLRFRPTDLVNSIEEEDSGQNQECKRYKLAGAVDQRCLRYPTKYSKEDDCKALEHIRDIAFEDFFGDSTACDGIICEGANDFSFRSDINVFVTCPLSEEQSLITRNKREILRFSLEELVNLKILPVEVGQDEEPFTEEELANAEEVESSDQIPKSVQQLLDIAQNGLPVFNEFLDLATEFQNITKAAVVLANIQNESERTKAHELVEQLQQLRADPEIARNIGRSNDYGGRLSTFVCNLTNPRDTELTKALTRIKRPIQKFFPWYSQQHVNV